MSSISAHQAESVMAAQRSLATCVGQRRLAVILLWFAFTGLVLELSLDSESRARLFRCFGRWAAVATVPAILYSSSRTKQRELEAQLSPHIE
jgi:hypothetical protein